MTVEMGLFFSAIGCVIGVATFVFGRQSVSKKESLEWGAFQAELKTDVKNIKRTVDKVETKIDIINEQYSGLRTDVEVIKRDLKTAFSRIDDLKLK